MYVFTLLSLERVSCHPLLPPTPQQLPSLLTCSLELWCLGWGGGGCGAGVQAPTRLGQSRAVLTQTQADPTSSRSPTGSGLMAAALVGPGLALRSEEKGPSPPARGGPSPVPG